MDWRKKLGVGQGQFPITGLSKRLQYWNFGTQVTQIPRMVIFGFSSDPWI